MVTFCDVRSKSLPCHFQDEMVSRKRKKGKGKRHSDAFITTRWAGYAVLIKSIDTFSYCMRLGNVCRQNLEKLRKT